MIARLWHGVTSVEDANAYEQLLRGEVLPGINRVYGYRGAYLLQREIAAGFEFATLTLFDDLEAVRRFAGEDYEIAVVPPAARRLLLRYDERSIHYRLVPGPRFVLDDAHSER